MRRALPCLLTACACASEASIPDRELIPGHEGRYEDASDLGAVISTRFLLVGLAEDAGEDAIDRITGTSGCALGGTLPEARIVQLDCGDQPDTSAVRAGLAALQGLDAVNAVSYDVELVPAALPPAGDAGWDYARPSPTWGLRAIAAPAAWNLRDHLARSFESAGRPRVPVVVMDSGFHAHPDLEGVMEPYWPLQPISTPDGSDTELRHGTVVAGVIGARWNGVHADGVSPFVTIYATPALETITLVAAIVRLRLHPAMPRLINISLGTCSRPCPVVSALLGGVLAQAFASDAHMGDRLFIVSAGNEPFAAADQSALVWAAQNGVRSILVVEALAPAVGTVLSTQRAPWSAIDGGGVLAPGEELGALSWDGSRFGTAPMSGTSFAAPLVTGAAAYLLALEPSLTRAELKTLLSEAPYAIPYTGGGTSTGGTLHLLNAVLGIDRLRSPSPSIVERLADMDDGTPDGFTRTGAPLCSEGPGGESCPAAPVTEDQRGDGRVDLADFRRLRDSHLMMSQRTFLDAAPDNPKLDLNQNGRLDFAAGGGDPSAEVYPRAALGPQPSIGGDANATSSILGTRITDVDLFARAYEPDPLQPWPKEALSRLMRSADLVVRREDATAALAALGATRMSISVAGTADPNDGDVPADLTPLSELSVDGVEDRVITTPLRRDLVVRVQPDCAVPPYEITVGAIASGEDRALDVDPPSCHVRCDGRDPCAPPDGTPPPPPPPPPPPGCPPQEVPSDAGSTTVVTSDDRETIYSNITYGPSPGHVPPLCFGPAYRVVAYTVRERMASYDISTTYTLVERPDCQWELTYIETGPSGTQSGAYCWNMSVIYRLPWIEGHCYGSEEHWGESGVVYMDGDIAHSCTGPLCNPVIGNARVTDPAPNNPCP